MRKKQIPFYIGRNKQLILNACDGMAIKDIAAAAGITRSRVDQILSKAVRVLRSRISLINIIHAKKEDYFILGITSDWRGLTNAKHFQIYGWMHKLLINCYFETSEDENMVKVYNFLKAKQEIELTQVTEEWHRITRDVLWGKSIEAVAKELHVEFYDVTKIIQLTCYKLQPKYLPTYWYYDKDIIEYYRNRKRVFFDPIELNISNLRYAPILNYLEEGETPQYVTPVYLQSLFERKHANVGIIFSVELYRSEGHIAFHDSAERHGYGSNELIVVFDNGPQRLVDYRDDLMYIFVAVGSADFEHFSNFNNFGWVDLMLNLMTYLSTPRAEEQLEQAAQTL